MFVLKLDVFDRNIFKQRFNLRKRVTSDSLAYDLVYSVLNGLAVLTINFFTCIIIKVFFFQNFKFK